MKVQNPSPYFLMDCIDCIKRTEKAEKLSPAMHLHLTRKSYAGCNQRIGAENMSKLDDFLRQERENNLTYQFFVKMDNEHLLDWINTVAVTAEHQDHIDIITHWILAERGYELVPVPGAHWTQRYRLEPIPD